MLAGIAGGAIAGKQAAPQHIVIEAPVAQTVQAEVETCGCEGEPPVPVE